MPSQNNFASWNEKNKIPLKLQKDEGSPAILTCRICQKKIVLPLNIQILPHKNTHKYKQIALDKFFSGENTYCQTICVPKTVFDKYANEYSPFMPFVLPKCKKKLYNYLYSKCCITCQHKHKIRKYCDCTKFCDHTLEKVCNCQSQEELNCCVHHYERPDIYREHSYGEHAFACFI